MWQGSIIHVTVVCAHVYKRKYRDHAPTWYSIVDNGRHTNNITPNISPSQVLPNASMHKGRGRNHGILWYTYMYSRVVNTRGRDFHGMQTHSYTYKWPMDGTCLNFVEKIQVFTGGYQTANLWKFFPSKISQYTVSQ